MLTTKRRYYVQFRNDHNFECEAKDAIDAGEQCVNSRFDNWDSFLKVNPTGMTVYVKSTKEPIRLKPMDRTFSCDWTQEQLEGWKRK